MSECCKAKPKARGMCSACYQRWWRNNPEKVGPRGRRKGSTSDAQAIIKQEDLPRLKALLAKQCLNFAEIGKRFGVTRERIRQLAKKYGYEKGLVRQRVCTVTWNVEEAMQAFERRFWKLKADCPYPVEPVFVVKSQGRIYSPAHKVLIAGKPVHVAFGSIQQGSYRTVKRPKSPGVAIFPDGYLILPESAPSTEYIMFALNPKWHGPKSNFHGWPDYWNAWHLISPAHFEGGGQDEREGEPPKDSATAAGEPGRLVTMGTPDTLAASGKGERNDSVAS